MAQQPVKAVDGANGERRGTDASSDALLSHGAYIGGSGMGTMVTSAGLALVNYIGKTLTREVQV